MILRKCRRLRILRPTRGRATEFADSQAGMPWLDLRKRNEELGEARTSCENDIAVGAWSDSVTIREFHGRVCFGVGRC